MRPDERDVLTEEDYVQGILKRDRTLLARAITLTESRLPAHQAMAQDILTQLHQHTGKSIRVGISGIPGVGKSTFIDALGTYLTKRGHSVAVLAVDPSSSRNHGSILGDKTRMQRLSSDPNAYIRPSPTTGTLGGVTRATRESILLCEAAGFDIVLVETVGVGQSEVSIASMVDFYLVLMLPGGGDELQGIKKGVLEIADLIAVNKADPGEDSAAKSTAADYRSALHIITPRSNDWKPSVVICSALHETGITEIWDKVLDYKDKMQASGYWQRSREKQQIDWMWTLVEKRLLDRLHNNAEVNAHAKDLEKQVIDGQLTALGACNEIIALFDATQQS